MSRTSLAVLSAACLALACQGSGESAESGDVDLDSVSQAVLSSCALAWWMPIAPPVHGEDRHCTFSHQGRSREYFVHVPPATGSLGVVLEMHGGGGWVPPPATQIVSGWEQIADTEALNGRPSFYVVWPTGRGPATQTFPFLPDWWTCEYKRAGCPPIAGEANERDFLIAVLDDLAARGTVDVKRVYAVGLSSGAAMTHMLACDHSDKFAAVATMAGGVFSVSQQQAAYNYDLRPLCHPARKVPHFYAHAAQDAVVPVWEGQASVSFWLGKLGCSTTPASTNSFESPADEDAVNDPSICQRFDCQASAKLEFCILDASRDLDGLGGHAVWFGDDLEPPGIFPELNGAPHRLARLAWQFMRQFTLP